MRADFPELIRNNSVWVLEQGLIVGFVVMYKSNNVLQLDNVAVDPVYHGNGFGRMLLAFAEDHANTLTCSKVTLYTNIHMTENLSFYPTLGYVETGRRIEDGFDRVYFTKDVAQPILS